MPASIDPFYAIEISQIAGRLAADGRDIIHLEFGQPQAGAPKAALDVARQALDEPVPGYWQSHALKTRLCQHYEEQHGVEIAPDRIFLTCGASPALVLALVTAFSPGDRVAIARPGYVAYRNTLKGLHMVAEEIPCGPETGFQLTADNIAALNPAPDGIIIASPSNPTGTIIAPVELARIADVCTSRGIRIISDEIHHGLTYTKATETLLASTQEAFVVNSFSKYFCMPGWRIGWMLAPAEMAAQANAYIGNFFLTSPSLSQKAALAALDSREELDRHIDTYAGNRERLLDALPRIGLGEIAPPDGAFYIYANVGAFTDDSFELCKQILTETGVVIAPGRDFDPVNGHKYVRFSFAVDAGTIEAALERLQLWFSWR